MNPEKIAKLDDEIRKLAARLNAKKKLRRKRTAVRKKSDNPQGRPRTGEEKLYVATELVKQGIAVRTACEKAGISPTTGYNYGITREKIERSKTVGAG